MAGARRPDSLTSVPVKDNRKLTRRFGELVGRGCQSEVYAQGNDAVKVYRAGYPKTVVFAEALVMALVESTGLPIARIHEVLLVDGRYALRMDRAQGTTLLDRMRAEPERTPEFIDELVKLQIRVHTSKIAPSLSLKNRLRPLISSNARLDDHQKRSLLVLLDELPEGDALCHGDFHAGNILWDNGRYVIIDWVEVSTGCALGDACRTYLDHMLLPPGEKVQGLAEMYLDKYCAATGAKREEVLQWLPVHAASILGELPDAMNDILKRLIVGFTN